MKTVAPPCLALLVAAFALADDAPKPAAALDSAKLVGDWSITSGTRAGETVDKDRLKATITFAKDTITIPTDQGEKFLIAYTVDAKAAPATIDMEIKDGPVKEGKANGIIALDGDELKLCYVMAGEKRPAKFESTKDNNAFAFTLKRAKK